MPRSSPNPASAWARVQDTRTGPHKYSAPETWRRHPVSNGTGSVAGKVRMGRVYPESKGFRNTRDAVTMKNPILTLITAAGLGLSLGWGLAGQEPKAETKAETK